MHKTSNVKSSTCPFPVSRHHSEGEGDIELAFDEQQLLHQLLSPPSEFSWWLSVSSPLHSALLLLLPLTPLHSDVSVVEIILYDPYERRKLKWRHFHDFCFLCSSFLLKFRFWLSLQISLSRTVRVDLEA